MEHNTPDLIVIEKGKKWTIVDFSVPLDQNVKSKEDDKLTRYGPLAGEVGRIHKVRTEIIPIVIGALGTVPKRLPKYIASLGIKPVILRRASARRAHFARLGLPRRAEFARLPLFLRAK